MAILIGMDEAGYGPNLGPLVVAATAWDVRETGTGLGIHNSPNGELASAGGHHGTRANPGEFSITASPKSLKSQSTSRQLSDQSEIDLYRLLRSIVSRSASERQMAIADSKTLYKPGLGLRQLERGVLGSLAAMGAPPACWSDLIERCEADPHRRLHKVPWHDDFDCGLPMDAAVDEVSQLGQRMTQACEAAGVRPLAIRARLVFPAEFNDLVDVYGTKGAALSHVTIGLLREVVEFVRAGFCPPAEAGSPLSVVCDKHGGRNHYAALLQHHFSEYWIEPLLESRAESVYEWGSAESRVRAAFRVGGESFLPTALASMTAKYLRELAMRAFNEFWSARVQGLRPTAGYPNDAPRFHQDIVAAQRELKLDDRILWRNR